MKEKYTFPAHSFIISRDAINILFLSTPKMSNFGLEISKVLF